MTASLQTIGLTPAKGALILVLGGVLLFVWGPQVMRLAGGGQANRPRQAAARTPSASTANRPSSNRAPGQTSPRARGVAAADAANIKPQAPAVERELPAVTLAEAVAHDPFAPPSWLPQSSVAVAQMASPDEYASRFEALQENGVAMVLVSSGGRAAQIGDRMLRPGDVIDGFRVVEITDAGVTLTPAPTDETGDSRGG